MTPRTGSIDVTIKGNVGPVLRSIERADRSIRRLGRIHELARTMPRLRHRVRWMERRCEGIPWWRPVERLRRASALRGARADLLRHEVEYAAVTRR